MHILHIQYAGGTGGIEKLCRDIALYDRQDDNYFLFVHEGGIICEEMKKDGANVIMCSYNNKDIMKLYHKLDELVKRNAIDVIVVHHPAPLVWISLIMYSYRNSRTKICIYAHNSYWEIVKNNTMRKNLYKFLLNRSDAVIAISQFVKDTFIDCKSGAKEDKIHVIYNGIKLEDYQNSIFNEQHKDRLELIYVGRLIKEKGVHVLIEAMGKLKSSNKFHLTIVGDGRERSELERLAITYGVNENIDFVGNKRNVAEYLRKSDVFVHPAVWEEGFGITIVEAMCSGVIPVTFKKGALPEIIDSGLNGYIVDICSAESLANQLNEIADLLDCNGLAEMKMEAVKKASKFSIENLLAKSHELYAQL